MIKNIISNNLNYDFERERISKLKSIYPECFDSNGQLRIEMLNSILKSDVKTTKESFEINFLGKAYAKMIAGIETETVIRPDQKHNNLEANKNSSNIMISGDNLDALKHLIKSYENKIKCIYIDPPYNTETDGFCYVDNFKFDKKTLMEKLDVEENEADRILNMTSNASSTHSAWLTFMYPRLYLAKNLLSDK